MARNRCPHCIRSSTKSTLQPVCWQGMRSHPSLLAELCQALTKWCISPFPLCEVITRKSGLRLLVASCVLWEGGGGDLAGMILPKLLPLETGRRPGEALALT